MLKLILLLCFLYFVHTVPIPRVSLSLSATQGRVGESVRFTISFDNVGDVIGYGPYVDLLLPVNATSWLNAFSVASTATTTLDPSIPITPTVRSFTSKTLQPAGENYCVTHPISQTSVCMYGGYAMYTFEFPLMSYSPAQTELQLSLSSTIIAFSNGSFADITAYARGGFRYTTLSANGAFCCATTSDAQTNGYAWSVYATFKAVFWFAEYGTVAIPWSKSSLFANESEIIVEYSSSYEWLVNTGIWIKNCTLVFEIPPCMILYLDAWTAQTINWLTPNNSVIIVASLSSDGSIKGASEFAFPVTEFSKVIGPAKVFIRILNHVGDGVKKSVPLKYGIDKDCVNLWECSGSHLVLANTQLTVDWFNWVPAQNLDYSSFLANASLTVDSYSQLNVSEVGNRTYCCIESYCPGGFHLSISGNIFGYCLCNSSYNSSFILASNTSWLQFASKIKYQAATVQAGISYLSLGIKLAAQANGGYCISNYLSLFGDVLGDAWDFLFPLSLNNQLSTRWVLQPVVGSPGWSIDLLPALVASLNLSTPLGSLNMTALIASLNTSSTLASLNISTSLDALNTLSTLSTLNTLAKLVSLNTSTTLSSLNTTTTLVSLNVSTSTSTSSLDTSASLGSLSLSGSLSTSGGSLTLGTLNSLTTQASVNTLNTLASSVNVSTTLGSLSTTASLDSLNISTILQIFNMTSSLTSLNLTILGGLNISTLASLNMSTILAALNISTSLLSLDASLSTTLSDSALTANLTLLSSVPGTLTLSATPYCVHRGELILECEGIMVTGEGGANFLNSGVNITSDETATASASASVDTGRTLHRVYAVDGKICYNGTSTTLNANCIAGSGTYLFASQVVTYQVIQYLKTSSVDGLCFTMFPPFPVFNITSVTNALSSTVNSLPAVDKLSFGSLETLSPFFGISPTVQKDVVSNMLKVCYGDLNDKLKGERIVDLLYTVQVTGNPYPDNLPIASMASMYTKTCGTRSAWNRILLAQPTLTISKSIVYINSTTGKITGAPTTTFTVAGSTGFRASKTVTGVLSVSSLATVQGGDIISFALVVSNTGHGTAYGVSLADSFNPMYMQLLNGGNLFISNGLNNSTELSGDLFSSLRLTSLPGVLSGQNDNLPYGNTVAGKNVLLMTYDVKMSSLVESGCTYNNQFFLMNYWPTPNIASTGFLTNNVTSTSAVTMNSIALTVTPNKAVVTIGETVTSRICVTFSHHGFVRSGSIFTIDNFSQGTSRKKLTRVGELQIGSSLTINSISQHFISYSNDAIRDGVRFTFGNITYTDSVKAPNAPVNVDEICVEVDYLVWNQAGFVNNSPTRVKAQYNFTASCRSTPTVLVGNSTITVIEPLLTVSAVPNTTSVQNGDVLEYTLTIRHSTSSKSTAYNIDLCGSFSTNQLYIADSLTVVSPATLQYNNTLNLVHFNSSFGLVTGSTSTIVLKLRTMVTNLTLGQPIVYNVCITWDSYPAFPLPVNETIPWRSYSGNSNVQTPTVGLPKGSLLPTQTTLVYGQCASLEFMSQALPQAIMNNVRLILTMSNQLDYVPQTFSLTSSSPSTLYSTLANDWNSVAIIANANLLRTTTSTSTIITFSLGNVINTDLTKAINELLTVNFKVDIASTATASSGFSMPVTITIIADGVSAQVTSQVHILLQEPKLTLTLSGSPVNSKICQQQQYQFSLVHSPTSNSTAYGVSCSIVMDGEWALANYGYTSGTAPTTFNSVIQQSANQFYPDYKINVAWSSIALNERRDFFVEGWPRSTSQGGVINGPQINCTWSSLPLSAAQNADNNSQTQSPPTCRQNPNIKIYASTNPLSSLPIAPDDLLNYQLGYCGLPVVNPIFTQVPSLFNAFVFEDFSSAQSDVEGRLAVGGKVKLSSYGVAQNLDWESSNDKSVSNYILGNTCTELQAAGAWTSNLVVYGSLLWENGGRIFLGDIVYGDQSGTYIDYQVYDAVMTKQCKVSYLSNTDSNFPVDFLAAKTYLASLSISLALLTPNGVVSNKWGNLAIALTQGARSPVVLNVDGSQLLQAQSIYFESGAPSSNTTVIINVSGKVAGVVNMGLMYTSSDYNALQHTLWNFYEATTVVFYGVGVPGTVLAPKAKIIGDSSVLLGQMYSRAFSGTMQINQRPFKGCVPCPNYSDCCPNKAMM